MSEKKNDKPETRPSRVEPPTPPARPYDAPGAPARFGPEPTAPKPVEPVKPAEPAPVDTSPVTPDNPASATHPAPFGEGTYQRPPRGDVPTEPKNAPDQTGQGFLNADDTKAKRTVKSGRKVKCLVHLDDSMNTGKYYRPGEYIEGWDDATIERMVTAHQVEVVEG